MTSLLIFSYIFVSKAAMYFKVLNAVVYQNVIREVSCPCNFVVWEILNLILHDDRNTWTCLKICNYMLFILFDCLWLISVIWSCFQETDFKEWKLVIQEIVKFLKADTAFMNLRPLRYSVILDPHPDCLPHSLDAKRKLKLRDALLCSYHPHEVCIVVLY